MGLKSFHSIKALIPHISELSFNNIKMHGGYLEGRLYNSPDVIEEILKCISNSATKLMKLKVTKMNLKYEGIIK